MKITKLTEAQRARFPELVDRWTRIGLSTEPADFERAERAYRALYEAAEIPFPRSVVRVSSPWVGAFAAPLAANILAGTRKNPVDSAVDSAVNSAVNSAVRSAVTGAVNSAVDSAVDSAVYSAVDRAVNRAVNRAVDSAVYSAVNRAVYSAVNSAVDSAVDSAVRSAVYSAVDSAVYSNRGLFWHYWMGGAFWPAYASWFCYMRDVLGVDVSATGNAYAETIESAGYAWPNRDFLMICDRPAEIHRDERGRLHHDSRMAISWRDGTGLYAYHGVTVPADVIERPESITPERIRTEQNAEVRRVMVARYGVAKYLLDSKAVMEHKDEFGELYRLDQDGDDPLKMVKVIDPAKVRMGDDPVVFLSVPPSMTTARAAVGWTFGRDERSYAPVRES